MRFLCYLCWISLNGLLNKKEMLSLLNVTDLKSRYDEEKSLREAGDQRSAKLAEQLQKEKQENERLQTELVQDTLSVGVYSLLTWLETYFQSFRL